MRLFLVVPHDGSEATERAATSHSFHGSHTSTAIDRSIEARRSGSSTNTSPLSAARISMEARWRRGFKQAMRTSSRGRRSRGGSIGIRAISPSRWHLQRPSEEDQPQADASATTASAQSTRAHTSRSTRLTLSLLHRHRHSQRYETRRGKEKRGRALQQRRQCRWYRIVSRIGACAGMRARFLHHACKRWQRLVCFLNAQGE